MNGPGRKSLRRRVQALEEQMMTPKTGSGKRIFFEHELNPGQQLKPWLDAYGQRRPRIIIRLDPRPAVIPEEDLAYIESGRRKEEAEATGWWTAFQLPGEEVN